MSKNFPQVVGELTEFRAVFDRITNGDLDKMPLLVSEFQRLLQGAAVLAKLQDSIKSAIDNPAHELPYVDSSRLVLDLADKYSLFLIIQEPKPLHLYSMPYTGLIGGVAGKPVEIQFYSLPVGWIPEVFDPHVRLTLGRKVIVRSGQVVVVDGRRELIDVDATKDSVALLKLYSYPHTELEWAFSRSNLAPISMVAADPLSSRKQYIAKVLGYVGNEASIDPLKELLGHRAHFVRWSAIQAIGRLDGEIAVDCLRTLAGHDLHPQIRSSAQAMLVRHETSVAQAQ